MKCMKTITAFILTAAMVVGIIATGTPSLAAGDDISEAQALEMVKNAVAKYQAHNTVDFVLESPSFWSYYAYDFNNDIGACLIDVDADAFSHRLTGLDDECDWFDFKNKIYYESYYTDDKDEELRYTYAPIDEDDVEYFKHYYFYYLIDGKEDGFPLAKSYEYGGRLWEYGPNGTNHECYIFEVPETDVSLYGNVAADYLPIRVYIGVEDGELYRIDEERYTIDAKEKSFVTYQTHFSYPESITIPEDVVKNATLSGEYSVVKKGIEYFVQSGEDGSTLNTMTVYGLDSDAKDSEKKNLRFVESIKVLDSKYKVTAIGYQAFYREHTVKTAVINKNITLIDDQAFMHCDKMNKVSFSGSKIREINGSAFYGCKSLKSVTLPNSVKKIKEKVFCNCKNLKTVTIGKGIKEIGKKTFKGCSKLKKLRIKNKKMRKYADSAKGRKELGLSLSVVVE